MFLRVDELPRARTAWKAVPTRAMRVMEFAADGAVFASNPYKNPTLTILAPAWRACDHLLDGMKKGSIATPA